MACRVGMELSSFCLHFWMCNPCPPRSWTSNVLLFMNLLFQHLCTLCVRHHTGHLGVCLTCWVNPSAWSFLTWASCYILTLRRCHFRIYQENSWDYYGWDCVSSIGIDVLTPSIYECNLGIRSPQMIKFRWGQKGKSGHGHRDTGRMPI